MTEVAGEHRTKIGRYGHGGKSMEPTLRSPALPAIDAAEVSGPLHIQESGAGGFVLQLDAVWSAPGRPPLRRPTGFLLLICAAWSACWSLALMQSQT